MRDSEIIIVRSGPTISQALSQLERELLKYEAEGYERVGTWTVAYNREMGAYTVRQSVVLNIINN